MLEAIGVVHTCTKDPMPWPCREGLLKERRACDQCCDEGMTRALHYQEREARRLEGARACPRRTRLGTPKGMHEAI